MNLTLKEKEVLTRSLEAGVRRSAGKLEKMSKSQWGIMSSSVKEIPPVWLLSWFSRSKEAYLAARFKAGSDVPLDIMTLFPDASAKAVTTAVTKPYAKRVKKLTDPVGLTIGEVSNVLIQGMITVLADEFDATIIVKVPELIRGPKAQILSQALEDYDGRTDVLLMAHVELFSRNLSAECALVTMVSVKGLRKLLRGSPVK